jgi:hypothetical protein
MRGSLQKFCTLYVFSLKMDSFYKIHLQAFNVNSIVLYHSSPTFGQVLYSCQDAFVVDGSFQKFCTLYVFSLKMNLFYKIHLQAFNVNSIVLYHSSPTFGQVLYSCADWLEIWEPHPPGNFRDRPGLYRDFFTSYCLPPGCHTASQHTCKRRITISDVVSLPYGSSTDTNLTTK